MTDDTIEIIKEMGLREVRNAIRLLEVQEQLMQSEINMDSWGWRHLVTGKYDDRTTLESNFNDKYEHFVIIGRKEGEPPFQIELDYETVMEFMERIHRRWEQVLIRKRGFIRDRMGFLKSGSTEEKSAEDTGIDNKSKRLLSD
jgi:hypothetical protein